MKKTQVITRQKMLVEKGSGNVYADLGFPDSADMLVKAQLVTKIAETARPRSTDRALRLTSKRALKTHRPAIFFNVCSAVHSLFIRLY